MDPPEKSLKIFYLNHPNFHARRTEPNDQTIFHLQHAYVPVHDTKILKWVKPLIINQPCAGATFVDVTHLQNIVDFL